MLTGRSKKAANLILAIALIFVGQASARNGVRLKDIVDVEGVRSNPLIGYGLVVGLPGSGDSLRNAPFTRQSLESMLERLGVDARGANVNTNTVAAVMVTAELPPFAASGGRLDVTVSAMGDARSLAGGSLLVTPLLGADGSVYATAQGPVSVGGLAASGDSGSTTTRNIPTNGHISGGGLIERELKYDIAAQTSLRLTLRNPDFTTAARVADSINDYMGSQVARASDPANIHIRPADGYDGDMARLLAEIETLRVDPDQSARVVINEKTGVVVMGENVRVSTVAIAQGNLTIEVTETPQVSQPPGFAGTTEVVNNTGIAITEDQGDMTVIEGGASLRELVRGLNALGVTPRDLISILQALKASGALQADIEVM